LPGSGAITGCRRLLRKCQGSGGVGAGPGGPYGDRKERRFAQQTVPQEGRGKPPLLGKAAGGRGGREASHTLLHFKGGHVAAWQARKDPQRKQRRPEQNRAEPL